MSRSTSLRSASCGFASICMACATLVSCGGGGISNSNSGGFVTPGTSPFVNGNLFSRGVCQANAHQSGRARWTVLVYMNAASNLQPDSLINVAQMASVGSNADVNIVVQWKQTATSSFFSGVAIDTTPSFVGTRRYLIRKHSQADINRIAPPGIDTNSSLVGDTTVLDPDRLADPATAVLNDNGNMTSDMGDYHTLADFVQWGSTNYPADHLAVVVWDHGSGAINVDNRSARPLARNTGRSISSVQKRPSRGVSQDVQTGNQIATQEMPLALATSLQKIDALIIDCSLQGTAEMAYDVRNSARVFVASEDSPPGTGYPYDVWLNFLEANSAGPCDAGRNLINDTVAAYPNASDITQSMIDLSGMDSVAIALNNFGGSLASYVAVQANLIHSARLAAQFFAFIEYKDLYHFANLIRTSGGVPLDLAQFAGNLETSLTGTNGAILLSSHGKAQDVTGFSEAFASGMSIFLPGPQTPSDVDNTVGFDPAWNLLGLAKAAPNWAKFLQGQQQ